MRDSFNNELQVGDRILYVDPRATNRHRQNQVGTIVTIDSPIIVVEYDLHHNQGRQPSHSNYIYSNEDTFIKIETHTEVEYRVGDKVLCYCATISNCSFVGTVKQKRRNGTYCVTDGYGNNHVLTKSEILFLLERKHFKIGDEVVVQKSFHNTSLFEKGYNHSIPATIHALGSQRTEEFSSSEVTIKMDDPTIGWRWATGGDEPNISYWTLANTEDLFPKEFYYSLSFAVYYNFNHFLDSFGQINSVEENNTVSNETGVQQLFSGVTRLTNSFEQISPIERNRTISNNTAPKLIHNYNYTPSKTHFYGEEKEELNENSLYLGIELEISGSSQESDNEEDAREIFKAIQKDVKGTKNSVYFKHDGSINGFEIVFHPHTIKAYNEYQWKEIFSTIRKLGYTNDDKKAGLHIHISRSYFGDESQQNEALAKMVFLMYKFKEEIEPLAGRKDSDYATYSIKALKRVKENDFIGTFRWYCDSCGKYSAINSQHKDTFELRIFDGVTDKVRFRDILNFVENLCNIVKCTSITDITKVRLEDFMPFLYSIEG